MDKEAEMVTIKTNDKDIPVVWCDPEIVDLVTALNNGGIETVASCSGHGEQFGTISLKDGRNLIICNDLTEHNRIISASKGKAMEDYRPALGNRQNNGTLKVPAYLTQEQLDYINEHAKSNGLRFGKALNKILQIGIEGNEDDANQP